jgi:hypothetical protein
MARGVWLCEHCDETIRGEDRVVQAVKGVTPESGAEPARGEPEYFLENHWETNPHADWEELDRGRLSELL